MGHWTGFRCSRGAEWNSGETARNAGRGGSRQPTFASEVRLSFAQFIFPCKIINIRRLLRARNHSFDCTAVLRGSGWIERWSSPPQPGDSEDHPDVWPSTVFNGGVGLVFGASAAYSCGDICGLARPARIKATGATGITAAFNDINKCRASGCGREIGCGGRLQRKRNE